MLSTSHPVLIEFYSRTKFDFEKTNLLLVQLLGCNAVSVDDIVADVKNVKMQLLKSNEELSASIRTSVTISSNECVEKLNASLLRSLDAATDKTAALLLRSKDESDLKLKETRPDFTNFLSKIEAQSIQSQRSMEDAARLQQRDLSLTLSTFTQTFTSPQSKGSMSESMLGEVLTRMYPSSQVLHTAGDTSKGDFMLIREGFPNLLIENKNYNRNVDLDETRKFLVDVDLNSCNGIMMSQKTGIVGRANFEINVHKKSVLVYMHNVNFDESKIRTALSIVDQVSSHLSTSTEDSISITQDLLEKMNYQFLEFESQKLEIKTDLKRVVDRIDALQLAAVKDFLALHFAVVVAPSKVAHVCQCGSTFTSLKALKSHSKIHK